MPKKKISVGDKFSRLTVLQFIGVRNKVRYWLCQCECGNKTEGWSSQLNRGVKKSCGCLKIEKSKESIKKIPPKTLPVGESSKRKWFDNYKRDAAAKMLDFKIDLDFFSVITKKNCHYCGLSPTHGYGDDKRSNGKYIGNGIDRINSDLGYLENNIVPCCKTCNYMKNTLSLSDFLKHIRRIYQFTMKEKK